MPSITLPASLEQLETVNTFLGKHIPERFSALLPQLELAAEELLVNVFSYAYPEGSLGKAEVWCREVMLDNTPYFCVSLRDWGTPFDPFVEAPEPDITLGIEDRPVGGLGIFLIKSMVAHYAYSYADKTNWIELYFALPTAEHEA